VGLPRDTPMTNISVASLEQVRARVAVTLRDGIQLNMSTNDVRSC